ncbi:glutaredoxin [bacterium]|nr:glutaredoxin [bacterium]
MSQEVKEYKVYRNETCPWGKKAVSLLEREKKQFDDHLFSSNQEVEEFKNKYSVKTVPQIFFQGKRIGGYTDLAEEFGVKVESEAKKTSYAPIIAVFSVALALSVATGFKMLSFMGYFLSILACLKLMNVSGFKEGFREYDLLARVIPSYANVYPFLELFIGLLFLSSLYSTASGSLSIVVGLLGVISITKAVYIDKKDLNCACIGGDSNLPLGFVSLSENLAMVIMGIFLIL